MGHQIRLPPMVNDLAVFVPQLLLRNPEVVVLWRMVTDGIPQIVAGDHCRGYLRWAGVNR